MNSTIKRGFSLALALILTLTMLPATTLTAWAASDPTTYSFDIGEGKITIGKGTGTDTLKVTYGNSQVADNISKTDEITIIGTWGGTISANTSAITVSSAEVAANIKLSGVDIQLSTSYACAFAITGGSTVNLTLVGDNTLKSGYNRAGLEVSSGNTLTITGSGSLTTTGGSSGAGIGGGNYGDGGTIIIQDDAQVTATGSWGAGIGGGESGSGGTITIQGSAAVTAHSSYGGAGIGGGSGGDGGTITIQGDAQAISTSAYGGAGIGGGNYGDGGIISIGGSAEVTATGGYGGAGIGGGHGSSSGIGGDGGTITIQGDAQVTATGGYSSAGIGGGNYGDGADLTISGGEVTASSIGSGSGSSDSSGTAKITGGTVTVSGSAPGSNTTYTDDSDTIYYAVMVRVMSGSTLLKGVEVKASSSATATTNEAGYATLLLSSGTYDITFTKNGYISVTRQVVVTDKSVSLGTVTMTAFTVALNEASLSLTEGDCETLIATVAPASVSDRTVTWESSNPNVAAVDDYGTVTGGLAGTATITVKVTSVEVGSVEASCAVAVSPKSSGSGDATLTVVGRGSGRVIYSKTEDATVGGIVTIEAPVLAGHELIGGDQKTVTITNGDNTVEFLYRVTGTKSDPDNYIFDISEGKITIEAGSDAGTLKVTYGTNQSSVDDIPENAEIIITGTWVGTWTSSASASASRTVLVHGGVTANIRLVDVTIDASEFYGVCAFEITGGSTVNLTLDGENTLISGGHRAGLEVNSGNTLNIIGTGSLTAYGGEYSAGIGAGDSAWGAITIGGSVMVTAYGGYYAAGIGGCGYGESDGGTITIKDNAVVNAYGGAGHVREADGEHLLEDTYIGGGAGIGGGYNCDGGTIVIEGSAEVTAEGGNGAAGIGGGDSGNSGTINIGGGVTVDATGGDDINNTGVGAGIGGGIGGSGSSGDITIDENAQVTAIGGASDDGIGDGTGSTSSGSIIDDGGGGSSSSGSSGSRGGSSGVINTTLTLPVEGVLIPYIIDVNDGVALATPTYEQIRRIIENADGGPLLFDFSGVEGLTSVVFEVDSAWFYDGGDVMILLPRGNSLTIPAGAMGELVNQYGGTIRFHVLLGSVMFWITQNYEEIDWYSYEYPMTLSVPVEDGSFYTVIANKWDDSIIPRSWYADGYAYAKVYRAGTYDAITATPQAFTDTQGKWMDEAVAYMSAHGVLSGTGDNLFVPERSITRAEFLAMLMHALNPEPNGAWMVQQFADVDEGTYYYDAAFKAKALGIVSGTGDNQFNPNATITRQDMLTMLHRAMELLKVLPDAFTEQFVEFNDWDSVDGYAQTAIQDLAKLGLVSGKGGGVLDPRGTTTRAEAAQVIYNLLKRDAE